jgi:hypothetical protein
MFACVPVAAAGTLSIKTRATVKTEKDRLNVTAKTYNKGDEAAHNVQTNIIFLDERFESQSRKLLMVNQSEAFHVEKVLSGINQGRYPLTVMVDFQDGNQYPFSAVVGTTFHYKKDVNPDLECVTHDLIMEKKDELRIETRNLGVDSKHIRATVVLPRELSAPVTQIDFHIDGRGEKTIFFDIVNLSALSGATYPVFCYMEYDSEDTHYTAVAKASVEVVRQGDWLRRTQWFWIGLAVFLGVVIVLYQFKRKQN